MSIVALSGPRTGNGLSETGAELCSGAWEVPGSATAAAAGVGAGASAGAKTLPETGAPSPLLRYARTPPPVSISRFLIIRRICLPGALLETGAGVPSALPGAGAQSCALPGAGEAVLSVVSETGAGLLPGLLKILNLAEGGAEMLAKVGASVPKMLSEIDAP